MRSYEEHLSPTLQQHAASRTAQHASRSAKALAAFAAAAVLSLGLLGGCSSPSASQQNAESQQQSYTVTFDPGDAQSQFGIQNAANIPTGREYAPGDTVPIPDIAGTDYNVFIPGYTLTGWQRSDTGEVIPVAQATAPDGGEGSSASGASDDSGASDASTAEDETVAAADVTEETPDGTVSAEAVAMEEEPASSNTENASTSSADEDAAEFTMPAEDVTLTAQWTPLTVDVYAADGEDAEPTFVATVDLSAADIQGSAEDTSVWQSYNTFNQGEARVFTSAFYVPLQSVFDQAGIQVDSTDTVILGENALTSDPEDTDTVEHDWDFYATGMFYPNTTCDTYSLDGAEAVVPSLSLSYKESRSDSKTEALSTVEQRSITEGISEQSAELCPRALFGVPTASYDHNTFYSGSQHPYNVNQILIIK